MMNDISIYNRIVRFIKQNRCDFATTLIVNNPGICERVRNSTGNNLLHVACLYDRESVAKLLFNSKSATEINNNDYTPLYYCTFNDNDVLSRFFVSSGVKPDHMAFFNAVRTCGLTLIKVLFTRRNNINLVDHMNRNLLVHAIKQKRGYAIIDYIMSKCDINQVDVYGSTPMHYACRCTRAGHDKVLLMLAKRGCDIICRDMNNLSPIDYVRNIPLKVTIMGMCRNYARYHRRRHFLMFLAQYKFLRGDHSANGATELVFCLPEIHRHIMIYL
jgi:ankyrin repeat protein